MAKAFCEIYLDVDADRFYILSYALGGGGGYGPIWPPAELARAEFSRVGKPMIIREIAAALTRAPTSPSPDFSSLQQMKMLEVMEGREAGQLEIKRCDQVLVSEEVFHSTTESKLVAVDPAVSNEDFAKIVENTFARCVCHTSRDIELARSPFINIYLEATGTRFYLLRWVRSGNHGTNGEQMIAPANSHIVPWGSPIAVSRDEMRLGGRDLVLGELAAFPSWRPDQNPNPDPDARILRKLGLLMMNRVSVVQVDESVKLLRLYGVPPGVNLLAYHTFRRYPWHYWLDKRHVSLPDGVGNEEFFISLEKAFSMCVETDEEL